MMNGKKFLLPISGLTLSTVLVGNVISCSCTSSSNDKYNYVSDKDVTSTIPKGPNWILDNTPNFSSDDRKQVVDNDVYSIGTNESKVLKEYNRTPQTKLYKGEIEQKYGLSKGFKYPSQKYNYKTNNQYMFGDLNGREAVLEERVIDDNGNYVDAEGNVVDKANGVQFNNSIWIKNEIKKGTFKKHPAADDMYLNKYDNAKAVKKQYTISTATKGDLALGLYAPAGEVVEIKFSDASWKFLSKRRNAIKFVINQNMWDLTQGNKKEEVSNRYPMIESHFSIDENEQTLKIGSCFGGGISIFINEQLKSSDGLPVDTQALDIDFTIDGAIPCLFYKDGETTEADWKNQIAKVKRGEIAPMIQATGAYLSLAIPFTGLNESGRKSIDNLRYPKENFKKWNDFLYLSNYYAGRDLSNNLQRLNMEFCDDIWGGASAWGGGMAFYCPTNWGINCFFYSDPIDVFNATNSWGVFHEINHNFQQDAALFKRNTHGETNQVTAFILGILSDASRFRSEINWTGEPSTNNFNYDWPWLSTPFSIMSQIPKRVIDYNKNGEGNYLDEYPIYSLINFTVGSKNYADYVRSDVREHSNRNPDWTPLKEIERLSDTFKINFYPAFADYGKYWNDTADGRGWPLSYQQANNSERKIIDRLNKNYLAMDFVSCQYACGSYLWNNNTKKWDYNNDQFAPFEIPAFSTYELKLDEMIKSTNINFKWNEVQFNKSTKLGGTLELDPNNNKRLIYKPNFNKVKEIDEFDICIIPSNWNSKPKNYVPAYRFKIKIKQSINTAILETFDPLSSNSNVNALFDELNLLDPKYRVSIGRFQNPYFEDNLKRGIKVKFDFVALEDGKYTFYTTNDDNIRMFVDGQKVYEHGYSGGWTKAYTIELVKGQTIHMENQVINTGGAGGFNMKIELEKNNIIKEIDPFRNKNILLYNIKDYIKDASELEIAQNEDYQYQPRQIDKSIYTKSLTAAINLSTYQTPVLDSKKYQLSSKYDKGSGNQNINNLNNFENNFRFELWNHDYEKKYAYSEFNVKFSDPTKVATLFFGHLTSNHWESRPTHIKVIGKDINDKEIILYDGTYGATYNDRSRDYSILDLKQTAIVKSMKLEMYNTNDYGGLIISWFKISENYYVPTGSSFGFNNPKIYLSPGWEFKKSDDFNSSALNNLYVQSKKRNDKISFILNQTRGFALIGQDNNSDSSFEIWINGKLYKTVSQTNISKTNNASLFEYHIDEQTNIKVDIINKSDKPIYLNYVMSFGSETYLK